MGHFRNAFDAFFMATGCDQVQFSPELVASSSLGESASGHPIHQHNQIWATVDTGLSENVV